MSRIRRNIENLRTQPDGVRVRAATVFALVGTGIFAVIWMAVLLPLQLRGWGSGEDAPALEEPGAVSGAQTVEKNAPQVAPPQPEPLQELHGTRPTLRGVGNAPDSEENSPEPSAEPDSGEGDDEETLDESESNEAESAE